MTLVNARALLIIEKVLFSYKVLIETASTMQHVLTVSSNPPLWWYTKSIKYYVSSALFLAALSLVFSSPALTLMCTELRNCRDLLGFISVRWYSVGDVAKRLLCPLTSSTIFSSLCSSSSWCDSISCTSCSSCGSGVYESLLDNRTSFLFGVKLSLWKNTIVD